MKKLLLFVLALTIIGWAYCFAYMQLLDDHKIKQKQDESDYQKHLEDTEIFIDSLKNEIEDLKNKIDDLVPKLTVEATMYHPVEAQCDDTPLITADGSKICPISVSDWNWIAVSQDLLYKNGGFLNYGDKVYIKGTHRDGVYTVRDCMNKRKTYQIDILESIGTSQYKYDEIELYALN